MENQGLQEKIDKINEKIRLLNKEIVDLEREISDKDKNDDLKAFEMIFESGRQRIKERENEKLLMSKKIDGLREEIKSLEKEKFSYIAQMMTPDK